MGMKLIENGKTGILRLSSLSTVMKLRDRDDFELTHSYPRAHIAPNIYCFLLSKCRKVT